MVGIENLCRNFVDEFVDLMLPGRLRWRGRGGSLTRISRLIVAAVTISTTL